MPRNGGNFHWTQEELHAAAGTLRLAAGVNQVAFGIRAIGLLDIERLALAVTGHRTHAVNLHQQLLATGMIERQERQRRGWGARRGRPGWWYHVPDKAVVAMVRKLELVAGPDGGRDLNDCPEFRMNGTSQGMFDLALGMALLHRGIVRTGGFVVLDLDPNDLDDENPTPKLQPHLVFFDHRYPVPAGASALSMNRDTMLAMAWDWVQNADRPPQPDHDGSNVPGWLIHIGNRWGHVGKLHLPAVAIVPTWALLGK